MRWLTLLLVTLNMVIFGWYWNLHQQQAVQERLARQLPVSAELRLLSELETAPVARPPKRAPGESGDGTVGQPGRVPASAASGSSSASASASASDKPARHEAESVVEPALIAACYRIGPFDSKSVARRQVKQAELLALVPQTERIGTDYRVVVSAPGSKEAVQSVRDSLAAMGLESFRLRAGSATGLLSLGVFREPERADALTDLLRSRQYVAEVHQEPRTVVRYLADIRASSPPGQLPEWLAKLSEKQSVIKTEKKVCQGLASLILPE